MPWNVSKIWCSRKCLPTFSNSCKDLFRSSVEYVPCWVWSAANLGQQDARCGFLFLVLAVCCVGYPIAVHLRLGSSLAASTPLSVSLSLTQRRLTVRLNLLANHLHYDSFDYKNYGKYRLYHLLSFSLNEFYYGIYFYLNEVMCGWCNILMLTY